MQSLTPSTRRVLYALLSIALVVHIASAVVIFSLKPQSVSTTPDPLDYRLAGLNLLEYHEFSFAPPQFHAPQLLRTPAYPFLLAGTYALDGKTGLLMILIQSVLVVGMGYLLFVLLRAFQVGERISLFLTFIYVFEPLQWLYTLLTMTETLASFLILLTLVLAFTNKGISKPVRAIIYGFILGLLVLVKPSATMWLVFLLLLILARNSVPMKRRITYALIALLSAVVIITPWVLRNHALTGDYVISSSSPFNFIYFAGTPATVPSSYYDVVTMASYNGHTNQVWYAYTAAAYPMLKQTQHAILAHANYASLILHQIQSAPNVWFGFTRPNGSEAYGHEYSLFANLALGTHAGLDRILNLLDTVLWTIALVLTIIGSALLLWKRGYRIPYLLLFGMLTATIFINFTASWSRMLLPMYPVVWIAMGVALTSLTSYKTRLLGTPAYTTS